MNPITQIILGKIGEGAAEGGLTGNLLHAAESAQGVTLPQRFDELAGAGQIQNGFGKQGSGQGSSVDLLSATASLPGRSDSLLDAHDLQDLYQSLQARRQLHRTVLLKQGEEFLPDLMPVGSKTVDGLIDGVVWAW